MVLKTGDKIGLYEIRALIGVGGMGEVYRARDQRLGRDVAIKVLPTDLANDPDRLSRFQREARIVAALNHPQIVTIHSVEEANGIHFLTMELVEGQSLDRIISAQGLPVARMLDIAGELADALAAAHETGVVHRDLKPANIMVTHAGRVKVLDFGLAKDLRGSSPEDVTRTSLSNMKAGMVLGTIAYMSPEQIVGGTVDHRSDIFSLGVVLYEMATGRQPFVGVSSAERISSILRDTPALVSEERNDLPEDLGRIVRRCLEKNPQYRVQTARDVANEFRDLRQQGTIRTSGGGSGGHPVVDGDAPMPTRSGNGSLSIRESSKPKPLWAQPFFFGAAIVLVALGAGLMYLLRPQPLPRISGYVQITHDGHRKILAGTDGSRLYFTQMSPTDMSPRSLAEVAATGGEIGQIPVAVPGEMFLAVDVSPDGSSSLLASIDRGNPAWLASVEKGNHAFVFWSAGLVGGALRRLGIWEGAVYSPDGRSVAYTTVEGDLWMMASDGTGAQKVGPVGGGGAYMPAWSPDGKTISFQRGNRIWEVASNGSNPHQLLHGWHDAEGQCCGHWTSDGKFFLFASGELWGERGQIWALDERRGLLRQPPAEPIQLTSGPTQWGTPISSRDGKKIFAEGTNRHGELSRYDAQSKQFQPFLKGISAEGVEFSKDGQSVAYVSYPEGILWKANRDGSNPVQLTQRPMYPMNPRWSPDGTQILFMDVASQAAKSYIVPSEGGSPRPILPNGTGNQGEPNWSPDGRKIVFDTDTSEGGLRTLDVASGQVTAVPASAGLSSPRWSPDGRKIVAVAGQSTALKVYDTEKQEWSVLVTRNDVEFPAFSADSQFLYYLLLGGDQAVYRVRVNGSEPERVVDLKDWRMTGYFSFWMGLDPGDAPLLLRDNGTSDLYALTLEK